MIAGHGRLAAARKLGMTEVPVIPLVGLTEVQRRQLVLADNRIALNAGWDMELLQLELRDMAVLGADLSTLGFTASELQKALQPGTAGLTDENDIPDLGQAALVREISGVSACTGSAAATARTRTGYRVAWASPC